MAITWLFGSALAIGSTLTGSSGKMFIKRSHNTNNRMDLWFGLLCVILLTPALTWGAISLAPQSLVSPFAALSNIWNTILASYFLREPVLKRDYLASLVLVCGGVLVAISAPHNNRDYSREEINEFFTDNAFVTYISLLGLLLATLYIVVFFNDFKKWWSSEPGADCESESGVSTLPPPSESENENESESKMSQRLHRFAYGALSGTLGGTPFFLKAGIESTDYKGDNGWAHFETYIYFTSALCITVFLSIFHLNQGMRKYDVVAISCIHEAFLVFNGSISGLVVFHEFDEISGSPGRLVMYFGGLLVCLIGIALFGTRPHAKELKQQLLLEEPAEESRRGGGGTSSRSRSNNCTSTSNSSSSSRSTPTARQPGATGTVEVVVAAGDEYIL